MSMNTKEIDVQSLTDRTDDREVIFKGVLSFIMRGMNRNNDSR